MEDDEKQAKYKIRESKTAPGMGIFTTASIEEGEALGSAFLKTGHSGDEKTDYSATVLGRFLKRSEEKANVGLKKIRSGYECVALRRIARFRELLVNKSDVPGAQTEKAEVIRG